MKRYNSMQIFTAMLAAAVMLVAGCTKNDLVETNRPLPPAGMGELTLGKLRLSGDVVSDPATGAAASDPTSRATAAGTSTDPATGAPGAPATDPAGATGAAAPAATATPAALSPDAGSRAATTLPAGSTLRLYAFAVGETDFGSKLASRTYTIDAAGAAHLDAGQQPLFLPVGTADIYLVGPVEHNTGTQDAPVMVEVASEWGITPRAGADLIAAYAQATVVAGNSNPLPSMELTHKMARVQVVVSEHAQAAYENLNVLEVKLYAQPQTGSYTLDTSGGTVTADETNTADVAFATIAQEQAAKRFSITTVVLPQAERELKIETTFECNQKNIDVGDNHPKLKYRQSGLIVSALAAGSATQFTTAPLTPVEIKWRTKVLPWNDVEQEDMITGSELNQNAAIPPREDQYIEIDGLKWAKGNLVAKNSNQCMVGESVDAGLYFQFGSLVGWTSGATGDGVGTGSPSLDKQVWPVEMGRTKPTFGWQNRNGSDISTLDNYYFNYSAGGWDTPGRDIREFAEPIPGDSRRGTLGSGRYAAKGVGDPCAYYLGGEWRLPTTAELKLLMDGAPNNATWSSVPNWSWSASTFIGAQRAGNTLSILAAGHRQYGHGGVNSVRAAGSYWSSSVLNATQGYSFYFTSGNLHPQRNDHRSYCFPVRCVSGKYVKPAPIEVEAGGLMWATGNLVADGANGAKIGKPEDGGLYFQFGSLIGWKGGATGDGTGRPAKANNTFYVGTSFNAANEVAVVPATFSKITNIGTTWPNNAGTNLYYFGYNTSPYSTDKTNVQDFAGFTSGSMAADGVGDPCRYYLGGTWRLPARIEIANMYNQAKAKVWSGTWTTTSTDSYFVTTNANDTELKFPAVGRRSYTTGAFDKVGLYGYFWLSYIGTATGAYASWIYEGTIYAANSVSSRNSASPVRCVREKPAPPTDSYIPTAVLEAAGWPVDKLPKTGLQVAMRGDKQLPGSGTAATDDPSMQWKTENTATVGVESFTNTAPAKLGIGKANTDAMIAAGAALHPSAQYCRDMGPEWYLPSVKELKLIYDNRNLLGTSYSFYSSSYKSSSERDASQSWYVSFNGFTDYSGKIYTGRVRCVREI